MWCGDINPKEPEVIPCWTFICQLESDLLPLRGVLTKAMYQATFMDQEANKGAKGQAPPQIKEEE